MSINFEKLAKDNIGKCVDRPNKQGSGTLSGHAAGEPFEKMIYQYLKKAFPTNIFKQYEFLNDLYLKNPKKITIEQRQGLFTSPTAHYLLSRGEQAIKQWNPNNLFEEKQNDTADILFYSDEVFHLLDVKTRNINKNAQPPNIISAVKLAETCALMLENEEYHTIKISYIEVDWEEEENQLKCTNIHFADLFKIDPQELYINWAAAMQLQFHVSNVDQSWNKDLKSWAKAYLHVFVDSARKQSQKIIDKYVTPYEKYIVD